MSGTFLGFDFGTKSIGVAVGNASPQPPARFRR
jgi:RNase H-fold protein (predicted Holliday junction resolvase)